MRKQCIECNEEFVGRADKKFCSDQCRSSYHNRLNSDKVNLVRNINNTLRKNRRILEELNPTGKATVVKDKLLEKGFNFNYFTNIYQTKTGNIYYFCYDFGYMEFKPSVFTIVKRQKYIE